MIKQEKQENKQEHTFERRIGRLNRRIGELKQRSEWFSRVRLTVALVGGLIAVIVFDLMGYKAGGIAAGAAVAAFAVVAVLHSRLKMGIAGHEIWVGIKSAQLARLRLDWDRIPPSVHSAPDPGHPFDLDLDMTGERSVHRLLDTAVTQEGSARLRDWLLASEPDLTTIRRRQALVAELASVPLFRDKLILNSARASGGSTAKALSEKWNVKRLAGWVERAEASPGLSRILVLLALLAAANIAIFTLSAMGIIPVIYRIVFFVYFSIIIVEQIEVNKAFREALALESTLGALRAVFRHLEGYRYARAPELARLCELFLDPDNRPSSQLSRVSRIISAISVRSNPVVWLLLNIVIPWDVFFVRRLQSCKQDISRLLPRWLDVVFEIEALSSLANFAALHPSHVFPELSEPSEQPAGQPASMLFEARSLGHPLIPAGERICNDFSMLENSRIALITGSNMAGKSSFLRTLGVNLCLAYAGGTVCAASLRAVLFRIFACMRVNDSVTDGFSYFYAEVKRMKAMLDAIQASHPAPVFFLLDEIFKGTNNRERLIGSRAYVRTLAVHPCMGAIATHDLELVKLADENPAITNYHFKEEVRGESMVFDYKLRQGPCPTTNALKIMAMVGLPVQHEED